MCCQPLTGQQSSHSAPDTSSATTGLGTAAHSGLLPDEFLDRFTVAGPPDHLTASGNWPGSISSG